MKTAATGLRWLLFVLLALVGIWAVASMFVVAVRS